MMKKTFAYYMSVPHPIELIPDEAGYWFAQIPLLAGCMTQGATRIRYNSRSDSAICSARTISKCSLNAASKPSGV